MNSSPNTDDFAALTRRWLDDRASAEEQAALFDLLLKDSDAAREFANQVRFDSLLAQHCTAREKALLEFAALDCEMPSEIAPAPKQTVWRTGFVQSPWTRLAAAVAVLAAWFAWMQREPVEPQTAFKNTPNGSKQQTGRIEPITLLRPRMPTIAATPPTDANTPAAQLALTLDDFYLPEITLDNVTFEEAARWLVDQLRAHNYAKRDSLDKLAVNLPGSAKRRRVTVHSGPVSFLKALDIIATLAHCESKLDNGMVAITDAVKPDSEQPRWRVATAQTHQDAAALGLSRSTRPNEVLTTDDQDRAINTLAQARAQLANLAPLKFVPLIVPSDLVGPERVITAAEAETIWRQFASQLPANLPVVSLPFTSNASTTAATASTTSITLKVEPVGEMNRIVIEQPASTTPATGGNTTQSTTPVVAATPSGSTALSDSSGAIASSSSGSTSSTSSTNSALALLAAANGLVLVIDDDGNTILMTPDGIPVSAADLTPPATASSLVLVPTN